MGAVVAVVVNVVRRPLRGDRLVVVLHLNVEEGDLAVGRVLAAGPRLLVHDVDDVVLLVAAAKLRW